MKLAELLLRNAIADKEFFTACANRELSNGGWRCDWDSAFREADARIAEFSKILRDGNSALSGSSEDSHE